MEDIAAGVAIIIGLLALFFVGYTQGINAGRLVICNEMHWKSEACVAEWSRRVSDAGIENFEGEVK